MVPFPILHVARMFGGLDPRRIREWINQKEHIFTMARTHGCAQKKKLVSSIGHFPNVEIILYEKFCFRRLIMRKSTSLLWFKQRMRTLLNNVEGESAANFKCASGWAQGFLKRWEITRMCRTNKHKLSFRERLPLVQQYHRFFIYGLQQSVPQRCPTYGRFPANRMWSTYGSDSHRDRIP